MVEFERDFQTVFVGGGIMLSILKVDFIERIKKIEDGIKKYILSTCLILYF